MKGEPISDLIDRQAAIDICNSAIDLWHGQLGEGALVAVKEKIEGVPSAQPEVIRCKDCKWKQGSECVRFADVRPFPDDYCSRAERKGSMSYFPTDIPFMSDDELIENGLKKPYKKPEIIEKADVVPVVRCKECKHWDNGKLSFECPWDYGRYGSSDEDDYCSYGERKE